MSSIDAFSNELTRTFGDRARRGVLLAPLTTFRVGGPPTGWSEPRTSEIVTA
jgi:hypothetical protein